MVINIFTCGSRCGCTASQSEKPPIQSSAVEMTLVLLWKGMTGSLARNIGSRGLASSSSLSARDSATAYLGITITMTVMMVTTVMVIVAYYHACRQASSGGQAAGLLVQALME